MIAQWILNIAASMAGITDTQLAEIEKNGLPATKALIDLINKNQAQINQAEKLFQSLMPAIDEATKEWQQLGPSVQILLNALQQR